MNFGSEFLRQKKFYDENHVRSKKFSGKYFCCVPKINLTTDKINIKITKSISKQKKSRSASQSDTGQSYFFWSRFNPQRTGSLKKK